jgi:hypothetical protein
VPGGGVVLRVVLDDPTFEQVDLRSRVEAEVLA